MKKSLRGLAAASLLACTALVAPILAPAAADPAPLALPEQITSAKIVDAGSGRTAENLLINYLYLSCTADGQPCMAAVTHSERNGKAFDGLFVFPYAEKQNYIPLVTFTAQSLRVRK